MDPMLVLVITPLLVAALLVNFVCLAYVSAVVHAEDGFFWIIVGFFRSTVTFIRGWQRARELEIKPVMIAWTITIVVAMLALCPVVIYGATRPPAGIP